MVNDFELSIRREKARGAENHGMADRADSWDVERLGDDLRADPGRIAHGDPNNGLGLGHSSPSLGEERPNPFEVGLRFHADGLVVSGQRFYFNPGFKRAELLQPLGLLKRRLRHF